VFGSTGLSEEQRASVDEKSGRRRVDLLAEFGLMHLRHATAIEGGYGVAQIAEVGRQLPAQHPNTLTRADLAEIPACRDYVPQREAPTGPAAEDDLGVPPSATGPTPGPRTPTLAIAIIGATGKLGGPAIDALVEHDVGYGRSELTA
jgi:hypothetical protein